MIKRVLYYDCLYICVASETQIIKQSIIWLLEAKRNVNNVKTLLVKIRTESSKLIAQNNTLSSTLGIIKSHNIIILISANNRPPVQVRLPKF